VRERDSDDYPDRPPTLKERIAALSQGELIDYITQNIEQREWMEWVAPDHSHLYQHEPTEALWDADIFTLREIVIEDIKGKQ
jgi:hypothetical protein